MSEMVASESTSAEFEAMESLAILQKTYPRRAKQISSGGQQVRLHEKIHINQNNVGRRK
jgi:hypothetical protein